MLSLGFFLLVGNLNGLCLLWGCFSNWLVLGFGSFQFLCLLFCLAFGISFLLNNLLLFGRFIGFVNDDFLLKWSFITVTGIMRHLYFGNSLSKVFVFMMANRSTHPACFGSLF